MTHQRICNFLLFGILSVASFSINALRATEPTAAVYQSGVNTVELKVFGDRDLNDLDQPVSKLSDDWQANGAERWDIASTLGLLSTIVYDDDDEMLDYTLKGLGFNKWVAIRNQSMAAHVLSNNEVTVIVFRGTNPTEIDDWRKNITFQWINDSRAENCRFHKGFWEAYLLVRNEVYTYLRGNPTKNVWVTGHSLGGAMAVLCSVDLECEFTQRDLRCVTFGQPRVADRQGAQWIDSKMQDRYLRFVHGNDIVPRLPFTVPGYFPYAHAGFCVALSDSGVQAGMSQDNPVLEVSRTYCGKCGGVISTVATANLYQPGFEPPPLTQSEFQQYLPNTRQCQAFGATTTPASAFVTLSFPGYISDHLMGGYLKVIRGNRDMTRN